MKNKIYTVFGLINFLVVFLSVFWLCFAVYHYYETDKLFDPVIISNLPLLNNAFFFNIGIVLNFLFPIGVANLVCLIFYMIRNKYISLVNICLTIIMFILFTFAFMLGVGGENYNVAMYKKNIGASSVSRNSQIELRKFSSYVFWLK